MSTPFTLRRLAAVLGFAAITTTPAFAQNEIKLGAFLPVTGNTADVGAQMKAGMEVAVDRINQNGVQADGRTYKVRLLWYDDEGKGDVGLNVVNRALTVDRIHVGIGFVSSDIFGRVMDEFQKAKTPVIACCAASLKVGDKVAADKLTHVFQLSPTAADIANSVTAAVVQNVKPAKVALLNENTDSGRDFARITKEWLQKNAPKTEIVADEYVERAATDLTAQMAKIRRSGAQAIIGEIYGASAPVLFEQWFEMKVPAVIAHMGATVAADSFIQKHTKQTNGAIINNRWWPAKYTGVSEPMMEAYRKKTGQDATNFAVQGHDSALVALDAIRRAGSLDADKVVAVLSNTTFETAWGNRKFTQLEQGHRMPIETVVVQIQNGKKVPIFPPSIAQSQGGAFKALPPFAWEAK